MTNKTTIVAIAAITAILAGLPMFAQDAEATIGHVSVSTPLIGFDSTVDWTYDIATGGVSYEYSTYAIGCTERLHITSSYVDGTNTQYLNWNFPKTVNLMCDLSDLSDYANFELQDVTWNIASSGNQAWTGSSEDNADTVSAGGFYSSNGVIHGQFTAHYDWASVY